MSERAAVVGISQIGYSAAIHDRTLEELIFEAASSALADATLTLRDIESVILGASDLVDGRVISSMVTSGPAGGYMKDLVNVASTGEHALILAYLQILSGLAEASLVISWSKCSEAPMTLVDRSSLDPFYRRHLGIDGLVASALQASTYRLHYDAPEITAARVVVKNRANAVQNPHAERRQAVSEEEVLTSRLVAWPLKELEIPPLSDGVCALVLAGADRARALRRPTAWLRGVGWASETYWRDPDALVKSPALTAATERAYAMAAITAPRRQITVAEVSDVTPYHELMAYEGLGLCKPGEGQHLVPDPGLAVNPSGGVLSANPYFASGLVRIAEAALQVMGRAGEHQVRGATVALAQATSGLASQVQTVVVFGAEV